VSHCKDNPLLQFGNYGKVIGITRQT